jgi:hypothetical protein
MEVIDKPETPDTQAETKDHTVLIEKYTVAFRELANEIKKDFSDIPDDVMMGPVGRSVGNSLSRLEEAYMWATNGIGALISMNEMGDQAVEDMLKGKK